MSSGKLVLGVLAGFAAGAVAGILLAPDKGSKTRKRITGKGDAYLEEIKGSFNDFLESISQKFETAKDDSDDLIGKGKAKVQEVKKSLKYTMDGNTDHQS